MHGTNMEVIFWVSYRCRWPNRLCASQHSCHYLFLPYAWAARLPRSWVRIPPGAWMSVCCVLSGRGLCDVLITRPEESYRLWCVIVRDLETSWMRGPCPTWGCCAKNKEPYAWTATAPAVRCTHTCVSTFAVKRNASTVSEAKVNLIY